MTYKAKDFDDYISQLPEDRQEAFKKLRKICGEKLPKGFEEGMSYGLPGWFVPHSKYPDGYHCKPEEPLPFLSLASQKNHLGFYHSGVYAIPELYDWFVKEYPNHSKRKLDMGKSCIRFKKMEDIPYDLLAELCTKISVDQWIDVYEKNIKKV